MLRRQANQVGRHLGRLDIIGSELPLIRPSFGMHRRRRDHMAALGLDVDARVALAEARAQRLDRHAEVEVVPAGRGHLGRVGELTVEALQLLQRLVPSVPKVHVQHHQPAPGAGGDGEVACQVLLPPLADALGVGGRVPVAVAVR